MTLLILIVDDWKLTSLLEQVSATRVAFWTLLTGESWLAKPPVMTMVLMMMTMTMMIWFQTTTMLLPERRINFVTAMICSPLESNCVPLPQWERPASPVGHVRPRRAPICGWFVMVIIMMSWLFMMIAMILLLHTFRNVPSQSPGDFDEDCHQNDYYHDLLWCSWQCNDDMNENTVC